jgi:pyridoxal phosphate enzyme (YggS family)
MQRAELYQRYRAVKDSISSKLLALGRPIDSVKLVCVSKTHSPEVMEELLLACDQTGESVIFGENYIQEFKGKREALRSGVDAHFIGRLQRNKARDAVRMFSVIQSVDSVELLQALQKEALREGKLQNVFLQVNISGDPQKSGFIPALVKQLICEELPKTPNINVTGIMTITALYEAPEDARSDFRAMKELRDQILATPECLNALRRDQLELSMGMSQDYLIAIEEGATVVRVGSAIFGERANLTA